MPQFDMILVSLEEADGAEVLQHEAGKPARQGGGDETYRCGGCKTKLFINVSHHDVHGVVVKCGKCGRLNVEPHHHRH
ncbi:MAG TPA: MJ0042-type zinc finger domain-containing protein [Parvularculaceae bacterium]|nr:MJ0042-type zinc finger domain-containing protein [Parvularculaceae bacterium]